MHQDSTAGCSVPSSLSNNGLKEPYLNDLVLGQQEVTGSAIWNTGILMRYNLAHLLTNDLGIAHPNLAYRSSHVFLIVLKFRGY